MEQSEEAYQRDIWELATSCTALIALVRKLDAQTLINIC